MPPTLPRGVLAEAVELLRGAGVEVGDHLYGLDGR